LELKNLKVRSQLLTDLSKELLGPRGGVNEKLNFDPSSQYLVGVLEPRESTRGDFSNYSNADIEEEEAKGLEEEEQEEEEKTQPFLGIQTGPPKSMGISFIVTGSQPAISLCATWARYIPSGKEWLRTPNTFAALNIDPRQSVDFNANGNVRISVKSKHLSGDQHFVSIYLINETNLPDPEHVQTQDLIFQPQIRVVKEENTNFSPIIGEQLRDKEEASLSLLYLNKHAYARGHLCGAIWQEIDPERGCDIEDDYAKKQHPFQWIDKDIIEDPAVKNKFTKADLRTEFLPCYSIEQKPLLNIGNLKYNAGEISESWGKENLQYFFEPLIAHYERWIKSQDELLGSVPIELRETAKQHIELCKESLHRIQEGFNLISNDERTRLSFCFMNQVMNLQSKWKSESNRELVWRPFQIAFILQCIPSVVDEMHVDRDKCDLLWFPTGGGKTEAYLGLAIFLLAFRRLQRQDHEDRGIGTAIISRYTLRLLTIQQFRRALFAITASDFLRVQNWHPKKYNNSKKNLWGEARFSIGLWVGGDVTPNRLLNRQYPKRQLGKDMVSLGATGLLMPRSVFRNLYVVVHSKGDPVQVLNCPACNNILAITGADLAANQDHWLHWIIYSPITPKIDKALLNWLPISVSEIIIKQLPSGSYFVLSMRIHSSCPISGRFIEQWWAEKVRPQLPKAANEEFVKPNLPGYFLKKWGISKKPVDFEIHCTNPECVLNKTQWFEKEPIESLTEQENILKPFRIQGSDNLSFNVPISAYVVDDQIYGKVPSMIVSTVDKFARLSFEPRAASIFGNVSHYDTCFGYYRESALPDRGKLEEGEIYQTERFKPPALIIQDELHLIEGPLGSMVGLYETAVDVLCSEHYNGCNIVPKYIASSATVRRASFQIKAIFDRETRQFPAPGVFIEDNCFGTVLEPHQLDSSNPGRLYVGICAPGKGPHTPIIRIWSSLLQSVNNLRIKNGASDPEVDQFFTLVGFFNAMRELATTEGLYHQDIAEWLNVISKRKSEAVREISLDEMELSSRMASAEIPNVLNELSKFPNNKVDSVFATSMFGTGVDVDRLGLMVVHGQPKTTAAYIQATGRVGRKMGGLVITFLRATRPRDLDHYEFFTGYHRSLARYVEPITVNPFSPRARERAIGPLSVAILRNAKVLKNYPVDERWPLENDHRVGISNDSGPKRMRSQKTSDEVKTLLDIVEERSQSQPTSIKPVAAVCAKELDSDLDKWRSAASEVDLMYYEQTMTKTPKCPVVLGDPQHKAKNKKIVYENAPTSLREVEGSATFGSG
jgi:hypothetical protein